MRDPRATGARRPGRDLYDWLKLTTPLWAPLIGLALDLLSRRTS